MVESFVDEVLKDILSKDLDISQQVFILPSKRSGAFLKHSLSQLTEETIFSPEILSIEQFIENVSLLKSISNTELFLEFYQVYKENTSKDQLHEFDSFCKWAQVMVQDFNEVDRYLVPPEKIFKYLSAIKEVDHWSVSPEKTELISNYLSFWKKLPFYYNELTKRLIDKGMGYQGLMYREAVNKLELYLQHNSKERFVFLGFNALNTSEQKIIQELLHQGLADIYWDIDSYFIDSSFHDAGLFTRRYKQWPYFHKTEFKWECDYYRTKKNIKTIGLPKNVGQAKYVGELLSQLNSSHEDLGNTAVVLGDETLLTPLLNSIPEEIGPVNVTMGLSLKEIPLASLFELLFRIHKNPGQSNLYYKHVLSLTSNPFISQVLDINESENISEVHQIISKNNITYIGLDQLKAYFPSNAGLIDLLFCSWKSSSRLALKNCKEIIKHIKKSLNEKREDNRLALEHLFKFMQVFNQIEIVISNYDHLLDIKSLYSLFKELLATENLDLQGEPLNGLQILGVLESRVIDFETVIITSVNEGILPSGKSHNSFIPLDVKLEYGLPTYKEKDAVYTYHFYHLLQRAKNIYILYNTEVDALNGGEKSRFITQLEAENIHEIEDFIITPQVKHIEKRLKTINKTDDILNHLKALAAKGFSPSSLSSYIRNPMDFYYNKVLGINSFEDVEETVATNTFGTIIHNSLEELYRPYISTFLTEDSIAEMKSRINVTIEKFFVKEFRKGDITKGKNLIIFEITKRYISNYLNMESRSIAQGRRIKVIALEKELKVPVSIPELGFPVYLRGFVDRIDELDGVLRVIDYKTGKVEQSKVEVVNWEDITTDYEKYNKSFQVLAYAYMMHKQSSLKKPLEAGIISFKNLKYGLLKFAKKDSPRSKNKDATITEDTINKYHEELKKLILEIFDQKFDFIEKQV